MGTADVVLPPLSCFALLFLLPCLVESIPCYCTAMEGRLQAASVLPSSPPYNAVLLFTFDLSPLFPVAQWTTASGIYSLPIFWVWITAVTNMGQITLKWPRSSPRWMRCSGELELELEGKPCPPASPGWLPLLPPASRGRMPGSFSTGCPHLVQGRAAAQDTSHPAPVEARGVASGVASKSAS